MLPCKWQQDEPEKASILLGRNTQTAQNVMIIINRPSKEKFAEHLPS
jgi:hypothetical protein